MKKVLAIILCLLMTAALLPYGLKTAIAETSGQCGDTLYWSFDEETGTLTITGSGEMWGCKWDEQPWRSFKDQIVSVSLPDESDRASFLTWGNGIADMTVVLLRRIIQAVSDPNDADHLPSVSRR